MPILFWDWPRTLVSLGNKHLIFSFDYIEIDMTIIKNMSKSFYNWSIFFCWNLRNTKICYRNSSMANIKLKMFHTRYFIISVVRKIWCKEIREKREEIDSLYSSSSSLHSHLWRYCTSRQRKDLSVLLTPPIYIVLTTIWCPVLVICHIYMIFRSFYQISRTYVTIGKILDGPPAAVI